MTGVGPKVALAITGSRPVADLQLAIIEGDQALLTAIPGIGKRPRRAGDLRAQGEGRGGRDQRFGRRARGHRRQRSRGALQALGYSLGEARDASRAAVRDPNGTGSLEERVKAALRTLLRD